MKKKIRVLFELRGLLHCYEAYKRGIFASRSLWGMSYPFSFVFRHFNVLYLWGFAPKQTITFGFLKFFPFCRHKKVVVLMHSHPYGKGRNINNIMWGRKRLLKIACRGIDKALFFSKKSMYETIEMGLIPSYKCQVIHWGEDLHFINRYKLDITDDGYWVHTGKELRDWETIDAVDRSVNRTERKVFKVVREKVPYLECLKMVIKARGVVIIPNAEGLTYCTGWTCLVEAIALGKPIISVRNPYWPLDVEAEGIGICVSLNNPQEIIAAMQKIDNDQSLWEKMHQKALALSQKYNMESFGKELENIVKEIVKEY